jgi:4'-phosphopantetheinyl transferase
VPRPTAPPSLLTLAGAAAHLCQVDGIDVWDIALDVPPPGADRLLDAGERARAARFAFERDRGRFVAGRAALRAVLAGYLGADPAALAFTLGPHGKPALLGGPTFSFSNSQGRALCAVGRGREVGVDLEALRPVPDAAGIARSVLTAEEQAAWQAAGGGDRAFLRLWTRKEAALKALGLGLAALDGALPPAPSPALHDLEVGGGYLAALAVLPEGELPPPLRLR